MLSIIKSEKDKKSRLIIKAEKEIEILQEEKSKVINASRPTPIVVPATVSEDSEYVPASVSMSDYFSEGRLDGKPLGPSYIHSYYYAEPKPSGSRQTVYGAVSEISKGKKAGGNFPA